MYRVLISTDSVIGTGVHSALESAPDWLIRHESPQAPDTMAELAQCYRPDVTILDAASLDIVDLFQQLGQARVASFGRIIVLTLSGINEEALFFLAKWNVAAHVSAWTQAGELVSILCKVALGEYLLTSKSLQERRTSTLHPRSTRARARRRAADAATQARRLPGASDCRGAAARRRWVETWLVARTRCSSG